MAGTLIVSLDFELFWGMLDVCPLEKYRANVLGGRKAIPELLALFQKYGIHATWATVGFLFAGNPGEAATFFPEEGLRPSYDNPALNSYGVFPKIEERQEDAPCFFAPQLIELVARTPGQEIGSHTFSHYYCKEKGQTVEQFAADMAAAKAIAAKYGFTLTSAVLPRNQCSPEYIRVLRDLGFTAYRGMENNWIENKVHVHFPLRVCRLLDTYFPLTGRRCSAPKKEDGIWNLTGTQMFRPIFRPLKFLEGAKVRRIKCRMLYAAKNGQTFHLWWHPHNLGVRTEEHMAQLEEIFRYYGELKEKYGMESLNMRQAAAR